MLSEQLTSDEDDDGVDEEDDVDDESNDVPACMLFMQQLWPQDTRQSQMPKPYLHEMQGIRP